MVIAFCLFAYLIICGISFAGGFYLGKKKRPKPRIAEPSAEEQRQIERNRKELENLMNYNGRPQDAISD